MKMRALKLVSVLIVYSWHVGTVTAARTGPFKSSYTRVGECSNPTLPIDKNPPGSFFAELYNTTNEANLLRGKITVTRDHQMKKMKVKSYIWDNNKWKVSYIINNIGCKQVFFPVLVMASGIKYDMKSCTFYKGIYEFNDLSVEKMQHVWMKTHEYGRVLWRIEVFSAAGTVFCYDFETLVEPADN